MNDTAIERDESLHADGSGGFLGKLARNKAQLTALVVVFILLLAKEWNSERRTDKMLESIMGQTKQHDQTFREEMIKTRQAAEKRTDQVEAAHNKFMDRMEAIHEKQGLRIEAAVKSIDNAVRVIDSKSPQ